MGWFALQSDVNNVGLLRWKSEELPLTDRATIGVAGYWCGDFARPSGGNSALRPAAMQSQISRVVTQDHAQIN